MDGNGRWANSRGQERIEGHQHGVDSVRAVVDTAAKIGVKYLTIYAFSTENWGRPTTEVDSLMELLAYTISNELDPLTQNGVKMHFIGDINSLPQHLQNAINNAQKTTPSNIKLNLIIALNYSARQEITLATKKIAGLVVNNTLEINDITPLTISQNLSTAQFPDPDLLIRTSGEQRLSNFLLWQLSYTELYFTQTLWPDFAKKQLLEAIEEFNRRQRRFGKI